MNAIDDLAKRKNQPHGSLSDETPAHDTGKSGSVARAKAAPAAAEALPDPLTAVYGALRGLIDQGTTGIVVHVVAATQGEGASSIAKSIASTAATAGSGKVLLMDGKLPSRMPLSERWTAGVNQKTADAPAVARLAYDEGAVNGLFTGSISAAAQTDRVNPRDVKEAYAAWRQEYDLVIVDCPPVASGRYIDLVPDAADWVILVVQAEKLRPAVLRKVRETIEQQGGKILGVVLKDAKRYIPKFLYRLI